MKKTLFALLALVGIMIFVSCSDTETYADKKKKERAPDTCGCYPKEGGNSGTLTDWDA